MLQPRRRPSTPHAPTTLAGEPARSRWRLPRPRLPRIPWPTWRMPFDEGLVTGALLVIGIAVCLAVAVAPQLIVPWVGQAVSVYTFFGS